MSSAPLGAEYLWDISVQDQPSKREVMFKAVSIFKREVVCFMRM